MRIAKAALPNDERAIFGLAEAIRNWALDPACSGDVDELPSEADELHEEFLKRFPNSPIGAYSEAARTAQAASVLRKRGVGA